MVRPVCVCVFTLAHLFVNTLGQPQLHVQNGRNWGPFCLLEMLGERLRFWSLTQVWQGCCPPSDLLWFLLKWTGPRHHYLLYSRPPLGCAVLKPGYLQEDIIASWVFIGRLCQPHSLSSLDLEGCLRKEHLATGLKATIIESKKMKIPLCYHQTAP